MSFIPYGFYLRARAICDSEVAHASPLIREIWDYFLREANHKQRKVGDKTIRRGQLIRSYREILEDLHWYYRGRKYKYSKFQCEYAIKWLKKRKMIATQKLTRGMIVTVIKYNYYQNPENYKTTAKPQVNDTTNNNYNDSRSVIGNRPYVYRSKRKLIKKVGKL